MRAAEIIVEEWQPANALQAMADEVRAITYQIQHVRKDRSVAAVARATARLQQLADRARALGASDRELGAGGMTAEQRRRCAALLANIDAALARGQKLKR